MYVNTKRGPSRHKTLKQRQINVDASHRRRYDVVLRSCACSNSFGVNYHVYCSAGMNTYGQHVIDHEIISTVILLPSADSFKKGCCQLQAKVCAQTTG